MTLRIHHVADELVDAVAPLIRDVHRHDPDLAKQLRRAAQSVVLNVSEGEKLAGGNQRLGFDRAAGSLGETRAALRVASRWGYTDPAAVTSCDVIADRLAAMLWRLTHREQRSRR